MIGTIITLLILAYSINRCIGLTGNACKILLA